jgi:hypothetical protein
MKKLLKTETYKGIKFVFHQSKSNGETWIVVKSDDKNLNQRMEGSFWKTKEGAFNSIKDFIDSGVKSVKEYEKVVFEIENKQIGYDVRNKSPVTIDIEIKETSKNGQIGIDLKPTPVYRTLSISVSSKDFGGQAYDTILDAKEVKLYDRPTILEIVKIWKRWHLNDLKSGSDKQQQALKGFGKRPEGWSYDEDVEFLKKKGLYVDRGYSYGSSWLVEALPTEIENKIKTLASKL